MAKQIAGTCVLAVIYEPARAIFVWEYDRRIEIDQVCIVCRIALCSTDAVGVMTRVARCFLATNMLVMILETLIIENTVTTVALIAKRIVRRAFGRVVER